jgi:sarcosine oxidase subunit alpha
MGERVAIPLADGRRIAATIANTVFYDKEGARQNVE